MEKKANTFSVIFYVGKLKTDDAKVPIYARVTINGKRMELSMKQKIRVEDGVKKKEWRRQRRRNSKHSK
jgi:integrase/recombinase XerD